MLELILFFSCVGLISAKDGDMRVVAGQEATKTTPVSSSKSIDVGYSNPFSVPTPVVDVKPGYSGNILQAIFGAFQGPRKRNYSRRRNSPPRRQSNQPRRQSNQPRRQSNQPRRQSNQPRRQNNQPRGQNNQYRQSNQPRGQNNQYRQSNQPRGQNNQYIQSSQPRGQNNQYRQLNSQSRTQNNQNRRQSYQVRTSSYNPNNSNINCRCSNEVNSSGGNCTKLHKGQAWCYLDTAYSNYMNCPDIQYSRSGKPWSWISCQS